MEGFPGTLHKSFEREQVPQTTPAVEQNAIHLWFQLTKIQLSCSPYPPMYDDICLNYCLFSRILSLWLCFVRGVLSHTFQLFVFITIACLVLISFIVGFHVRDEFWFFGWLRYGWKCTAVCFYGAALETLINMTPNLAASIRTIEYPLEHAAGSLPICQRQCYMTHSLCRRFIIQNSSFRRPGDVAFPFLKATLPI